MKYRILGNESIKHDRLIGGSLSVAASSAKLVKTISSSNLNSSLNAIDISFATGL